MASWLVSCFDYLATCPRGYLVLLSQLPLPWLCVWEICWCHCLCWYFDCYASSATVCSSGCCNVALVSLPRVEGVVWWCLPCAIHVYLGRLGGGVGCCSPSLWWSSPRVPTVLVKIRGVQELRGG